MILKTYQSITLTADSETVQKRERLLGISDEVL